MKLFTGTINIDNYGIELYYIIKDFHWSIYNSSDKVQVSRDSCSSSVFTIKQQSYL